MKKTTLAIIVPTLIISGTANAAEIYNKNGNKVDLYGKVVGERVWHDTDKHNSENADTTYARFGFKGQTQITSELTGYGHFEHNLSADKPEGSQAQATRLAYAGLKFAQLGSFDYGRNYGAPYNVAAFTDMLVKWGCDSWPASDNFMSKRTNGVATWRNTDFFGLVEGLNFALQYQGKNENRSAMKQNGDGYSTAVTWAIANGVSVGATYANSDRTHAQSADRQGKKAELWAVSAKYDDNGVYAAAMYGESHNLTREHDDRFANKTQNIEAVVQYQFDSGLRPSLGYVYSKGKDLQARGTFEGGDAARVNYIEAGAWYYFNKNMNVYAAYKFNLLRDTRYVTSTGLSAGDQLALGVVYQF